MSDFALASSDPLQQCLNALLAVERQLAQVLANQPQGVIQSSLVPTFTSVLMQVQTSFGVLGAPAPPSFPMPHYVPFAPSLPTVVENSSFTFPASWWELLDDSSDSSGETPALDPNTSTSFDSTPADTSSGSDDSFKSTSSDNVPARRRPISRAAFYPPETYDVHARAHAISKPSLTDSASSSRTSRKRALSTSVPDERPDAKKRFRENQRPEPKKRSCESASIPALGQHKAKVPRRRDYDKTAAAPEPRISVSDRLRYDQRLWEELESLIVHKRRQVTYWERPRLGSTHPMKRLLHGLCAALDAFTTGMQRGEERVLRYHLHNQLSITHPSFRPAGAVRANTSDEANADTDAEADADLGTQRFFYDALTSPEHPPTCLDFFDLIQRRLERDGMALKKVTHVTPGENGFAAFELVVGTL